MLFSRYPLHLTLKLCGYTIRRGHSLCLSLSPCYWPLVLTPGGEVDPGVNVAGVRLRVPVVPARFFNK